MMRSVTRCVIIAAISFHIALVAEPARATVHEIEVADFSFSPGNKAVVQGDTVRWILVNGTHSTTSEASSPKAWDSGVSNTPGVLLEIVFTTSDQAGSYPYYCSVHPTTMKDTLHLQLKPGAPKGIPYGFLLNGDQAGDCYGTGSPDVGVGSAVLTADSSELRISVVHTIDSAMFAHVHVGPPCVNGPPILTFDDWHSPMTDTLPMTSDLLNDLFAGNLYVLIHTPEAPIGEIRGQITNTRCTRGDSDSSGNISIADAVFLINFIFGGGPAPSCP